jgi:hypothetical protein
MKAVLAIATDAAIGPVRYCGPMPDMSRRALASLAARFPDVARIKFA